MVVKLSTIKGHLSSLVKNTSPNGYRLLKRELWVFLWELHCREYPWKWLYRVFRHMRLKDLSIKERGANDFKRVWGHMLWELKLVAQNKVKEDNWLEQFTP